MSGTSLDGIDAALVDLATPPGSLVASHFAPYPDDLRAEALALNGPCNDEIDRAARMSARLADAYADAVRALLAAAGRAATEIVAIGCHGQTIRHRPERHYTIQLVDGARLAERTGICVVTDFRSRDIAAGGQGAPLVPAFHRAAFADPARARVVVNLGGIANITRLAPDRPVIGFDTGPGNVLLDLWASAHTGGRSDLDGKLAASGHVIQPMLAAMRADPYFALPPPKSTGRDLFHRAWLNPFVPSGASPADVQATLAELTATTLADAIHRHGGGASEVYLCGGGVHNGDLVRRIHGALPGCRVASTQALGIDPDWVEAIAFAWLAQRALAGLPGNLPEVTGAAGPRVLGAIHPA
jgi:anhydro-N-acetylmuramic acid kinase